MKTSTLICIRILCLFFLLICLPAFVHAQRETAIADLFSKYGRAKGRDQVELNGSILKSYRMIPTRALCSRMYPPIAGKFSRPLYTTSKITQRRRRR